MKHIETDLWCMSRDGEYFDGVLLPSREEAIEECREEYGEGYIGRCQKLEFEELDVTYDETGYYLGERLYDEIGDVAENWGMTDAQEIELSDILAKVVIEYINKHNLQPSCFRVTDIEEVLK